MRWSSATSPSTTSATWRRPSRRSPRPCSGRCNTQTRSSAWAFNRHAVSRYGPPGGGKTFVVRALAGMGRLSVHAVKGAELMDKWVGASEKAVRELFRRARDSAPSLLFLDELDALAPRRGQSFDSGVTDRVVAAMLTELDGIEPLRDVVVLGATNRPDLVDPALTRPGRLERLGVGETPDAGGGRG